MNELIQTFNFGINEVRTAIKGNGDVYFCLKDIATVLGIQDTQTKNFNLDEKGVEKIPTPTNGGVQELTFVSEPKQDFSTWVKNRISEYDFVGNQDFITAPQKNGAGIRSKAPN